MVGGAVAVVVRVEDGKKKHKEYYMKNLWTILVVIVFIGLLTFVWYKHGYDKMISLNQGVQSQWAQVENQLQRRFDLIPNLVNTVKGYANHEKDLLEEITRLRSRWASAPTLPEKVETANALTATLSKLLVVSENYPNLKANENFLTLQSQLEGTENRITVERMRYNQTAEEFNTHQQSLIGRFFANQTGKMKSAPYFRATKEAAVAPVMGF